MKTRGNRRDVIRTLLIEDDSVDAEWAKRMLSQDKDNTFDVEWVDNVSKATAALAERMFHVVLSDLKLPDGSGLEVFNTVHRQKPGTPVVLLTGNMIEEAIALEALREGAQDYLIKGQVNGPELVRSLRYAIERQRLLSEIDEKNRELQEFATVVAHDLREPLRGIVFRAEMAKSKQTESEFEEVTNHLERILEISRRMSLLISDIKAYYLLGCDSIKFSPTDFSKCVTDACQNLQTLISERNARVDWEDLPTLPAHAPLIQQVFQNLIANSIKFSPDTQAVIKIEAFIPPSGRDWTFSVRDNGIGIPEGDRQRIFKMFQKGSNGSLFPGSGVGLAFCKKIVQTHGGEIWVEPSDCGADIRFALPAKRIFH